MIRIGALIILVVLGQTGVTMSGMIGLRVISRLGERKRISRILRDK
jgi:hypothetical protein